MTSGFRSHRRRSMWLASILQDAGDFGRLVTR